MSDDVKVSKGLGFPVEALAGVVRMPVNDENEQEAARVFCLWLRLGLRSGWLSRQVVAADLGRACSHRARLNFICSIEKKSFIGHTRSFHGNDSG